MEFLSILNVLRRHRTLVLAGIVVALLGGYLAAGRERGAVTGVAQSRMLVDLPHSLVDDLRANADSIGAQTALLADLMAADEQRRATASLAGVPVEQLAVLRPASSSPTKPSPLAEDAAQAAAMPAPYTLKVTALTALPIITIDAAGPTPEAAARIARAATSTLETLATTQAVAPDRALSIKSLDPVHAIAVRTNGHAALIGIALALFLFGLWCCGIVVGSGLLRAWRATAPPVARPSA